MIRQIVDGIEYTFDEARELHARLEKAFRLNPPPEEKIFNPFEMPTTWWIDQRGFCFIPEKGE